MAVPKPLRFEYATTRNNNVWPTYGTGRQRSDDLVLLNESNDKGLRGYPLYADLARDPHTYAVLQKRYLAVTGREWEIVPGDESRRAKKLADAATDWMKALSANAVDLEAPYASANMASGLDQLSLHHQTALLFGYSVSEIIWEQDGGLIYPSQVKPKDLRRFTFAVADNGYELRLLTPENSYDGERLPGRKFLIHRSNIGGLSINPFGFGLGAQLFYPNFFKRNAAQFWLVFADKYATPTAVAQHDPGLSLEERNKILAMLDSISSNSGLVLPKTVALSFLESERTSAVNTYKDLIEFCNVEISKAVLGETGSTDQSNGGGSRARDEVGNSVRIEIAKADADFLSETFNRQLLSWFAYHNDPSAAPPQLWRKFPELESKEDLNARATRDSQINAMGFTPTRKYIEETYGIELEAEEPEREIGVPPVIEASPEAPAPEESAPATDEEIQPPQLSAPASVGTLEFKGAPSKVAPKTTKKPKNCIKGYSCGFSCIAKGKGCPSKVANDAAQYVDYLSAQVAKLTAELEAKSTPAPGSIAEISPDALVADPKRFQYKILGAATASGSVGSLAGVKKWDPNLGGIIQAWVDPGDGVAYVVNGHNRLELAKKLGADKITVRYLNVKDAQEARAVGALTNIAEGRGDALDAAKFFSDSGFTKADLDAKGIPLREKIATDGLALSKLEPSIFRKAIDGDLPIERAVVIGRSGLDSAGQLQLIQLVDEQAKKGRKLNNDTIAELAAGVAASSSQAATQTDLFGTTEIQQSNAIERAALVASVKGRLSRDKKLFGLVGKSKAAAELEKAGNLIDVQNSQKVSRDAAATLAIFDQLKNLSGPVSAAINDAATKIAAGENPKKAQDALYKQLLDELPQLLKS